MSHSLEMFKSIFTYVGYLFPYTSVHTCKPAVCGSQMRALDPSFRTGITGGASHHVALGIECRSSGRAASALYH